MNSDKSNNELVKILESKEEWNDIHKHIERVSFLLKEIKNLITKENSENYIEMF